MVDWEKKVRSIPLDWLLGEDNPSVRYFTLRDLLGQPVSDAQVVQAKAAIMQKGAVPSILAKQKPGGYWGKPEDYYEHSKYKGTAHTMLILAQLGADAGDDRIQSMCEFILKTAQDPKSGGFSCRPLPTGAIDQCSIEPCFTGNMTWALIQFGYLQDARVQKAIDWITTYQRFDDKESRAPNSWPYYLKDNCWGKHTCHYAILHTLKALAAIPIKEHTPQIKTKIAGAIEYLLKHHIFRKSHNLDKIAMPNWLEFTFPIMVYTDLIEVLDILLDLGVHDECMHESIDIILSKQNTEGQWLLERSYVGRFLISFEKVGASSKWITFRALNVIKKYFT